MRAAGAPYYFIPHVTVCDCASARCGVIILDSGILLFLVFFAFWIACKRKIRENERSILKMSMSVECGAGA